MDSIYLLFQKDNQVIPLIIVVMFASVIGSFLNVCIYRIPRRIFLKESRSVCPGCNKVIPFYLNIPIVSYLLVLKGRAKCCDYKIPLSYLLVEIITPLLWVWIYLTFPFMEMMGGRLVVDDHLLKLFVHASIFSSALLICTVTDLKHMMIPNVISYPLIILGPVMALIHPYLAIKSSLLGIIFGGGFFYVLAIVYNIVRKRPGLGGGDVKLLAAIGGWLGIESIVPTLLISSLLALTFVLITAVFNRDKVGLNQKIPYGPYLAAAALFHLLLEPRELLLWLGG